MALTVKGLRDLLADLDDDLPVILQKDAEGNGYSPLSGGEPGMYWAETTWSGEAFGPRGSADDPDDEAPDDAVDALILWPVN